MAWPVRPKKAQALSKTCGHTASAFDLKKRDSLSTYPSNASPLGRRTYCRSADQGRLRNMHAVHCVRCQRNICGMYSINRLGAEDWRTALGTIPRSKRSEGTRDAALVPIAQHITPFSDKTTWELEHCEICCPSFRSPVWVCSPPATAPRKP